MSPRGQLRDSLVRAVAGDVVKLLIHTFTHLFTADLHAPLSCILFSFEIITQYRA